MSRSAAAASHEVFDLQPLVRATDNESDLLPLLSSSGSVRPPSPSQDEGALFYLPKPRRSLSDEQSSSSIRPRFTLGDVREAPPSKRREEAHARMMVLGIWSVVVVLTGLVGFFALVT